jgi:hypothetical protein
MTDQEQQAIKTLHSSTMKSYMDHFVKVYNDPKIMAHYQYLRENEQDIHSAVKQGAREIVRIPDNIVFYLLEMTFKPQYGENWLKNKKVLYHELIRPWWIVKSI